MFPLCSDCWTELSPEDRLPYYRSLYERWLGDDEMYEAIRGQPAPKRPPEQWEQIRSAVLAGK